MGDIEHISGEVVRGSATGPIRVDRNHAVRVTGDAANRMKDGLGEAVRRGFRLAKNAAAGDVFELVPPADLAKGLKDGTLRFATTKRGDASVLIKNVETGRVAGRGDLVSPKLSPLDVLGPAAFEVMALATQQHYLAEISDKLEGIKQSVDEIKALHEDDRIGILNQVIEFSARVKNAADRDGKVAPHQIAQLRDRAVRAEEVWHQALETTKRQVEQYETGEAEPKDVQRSFCVLAYAVKSLSECSEALMTLPYSTADEFDAVLTEERDRLYPMLPQFQTICQNLLHASEKWQAESLAYDERRPKNPVARKLRIPPMEVHTERGFTFQLHAKPRAKPLTETDTARLRGLIWGTNEKSPPTLVAEVDTDGTVLLGPAHVPSPTA